MLMLLNAVFFFSYFLVSFLWISLKKIIERSENLKWNTLNFMKITPSKNFQSIYYFNSIWDLNLFTAYEITRCSVVYIWTGEHNLNFTESDQGPPSPPSLSKNSI